MPGVDPQVLVPFEDRLGWEYFGVIGDPEDATDIAMHSPLMMEHMDWHTDNPLRDPTPNHGESFLIFHGAYVAKFDEWRVKRPEGLRPVGSWDPGTQIPGELAHVHVTQGVVPGYRASDFPSQVDPGCITPTWLTVAGGPDTDPLHGHRNLLEFRSLDELGRSIEWDWHGTVHDTIGGDMSHLNRSPLDPVFWRFHKFIDDIRVQWERLHRWGPAPFFSSQKIVQIVRVLYGVVQDGPGAVLPPGGVPHPVPGGPGPILGLSERAREVLLGDLLMEIAANVKEEHQASLRAAAERLLSR